MTIKNLVPSIWNRGAVRGRRGEENLLFPLQREMNRMFDDFFHGWDEAPFEVAAGKQGFFQPSIDVKESDEEITIKAELPGMEENDIEVLLSDDTLTIKGEKKDEKEEQGKTYYYMERSYGSFHRVIPLPHDVEQKKVDAQYKKGVLSITLQKTEKAKAAGKKIPIKSD